ncbi:MAG: hypothetical protein E6R05_06945 [Candidatus Moraniibacteriota bacterium]|nr:MAG: hypothetical protein E6R05_06945 [Candidatus Moranbacteria bacterium]
MHVIFWATTAMLYVFGAMIGIAFISHFRLMRRPLPQLRYNYHVALRERRKIWIKTELGVVLVYILMMGIIWDPQLVAKYQKIELTIMVATMLLTAGFLQAIAWAVARWLIERPRPGGPTVLKA